MRFTGQHSDNHMHRTRLLRHNPSGQHMRRRFIVTAIEIKRGFGQACRQGRHHWPFGQSLQARGPAHGLQTGCHGCFIDAQIIGASQSQRRIVNLMLPRQGRQG